MQQSTSWQFGSLLKYRYKVIYVDPPWKFKARNEENTGVPQRSKEQHYKTMSVDDMANLAVEELAANDCALIMWTIASHLPQALWLGRQWGFEYSTKLFTWAKLNPKAQENVNKDFIDTYEHKGPLMAPQISDNKNWFLGMGYTTRRNTEDCYIFTKGNPKRLNAGVRELIVSPIREHSRKPDETYLRIEKLYDGPYCELFARTTRAGWSSWGNQTGKF